ncbi:MAG: class I SAM-dependent RNA methyltransferase [Streptosporangiaceae bacterium]
MIGTTLDLSVGPPTHGGSCVARHEGQVVFVRHALPGERVRAVVTEQRRHHLRADAVEVLVPSPQRVDPPCPYAGPGRCGGCDWQHARLPAQRELKAAVVEEQLRRLAGIEHAVVVDPVPGDREGLAWRTRVRFSVRGDGVVGLRRHRSHDVHPIDACLIAHPSVEDIGVERRRWQGAASVEAVAGAGDDRAVMVTPGQRRDVSVPPLDAQASVLRVTRGGPSRPVRGRARLREFALGRTWRVSGPGFWQVHPGAADALAEAVIDGLEPCAGERAVDLYCGAGLFAGALATRVGPGGRVTGVEANRVAVADARYNLRDLRQVRVEHGRVVDVLGVGGPARADLVVLDPPRTGAGRAVVERISGLAPRRVAYVACDPATLARDLASFGARGWCLAGLRAFDIFPMTHHVEVVATLTRGPE